MCDSSFLSQFLANQDKKDTTQWQWKRHYLALFSMLSAAFACATTFFKDHFDFPEIETMKRGEKEETDRVVSLTLAYDCNWNYILFSTEVVVFTTTVMFLIHIDIVRNKKVPPMQTYGTFMYSLPELSHLKSYIGIVHGTYIYFPCHMCHLAKDSNSWQPTLFRVRFRLMRRWRT